MNSQTSQGFVWVKRQFNDYRLARYPVDAVEFPHWTDISGGVRAVAPQPFLHVYVSCDGMIEGELAHSCAHGSGPHRILVCVTKSGNDPSVFQTLAAQAGPRPPATRNQVRPSFREWVRRRRKSGSAIDEIANELIDAWKSHRLGRVRIRPDSFKNDVKRLRNRLRNHLVNRQESNEANLMIVDTLISDYETQHRLSSPW
jgi:hypothetical protein